jgi:hypothetical protein
VQGHRLSLPDQGRTSVIYLWRSAGNTCARAAKDPRTAHHPDIPRQFASLVIFFAVYAPKQNFPQAGGVYSRCLRTIFARLVKKMPVNTEQELAFQGSPSEFTSLEEKIYRTIELLKHAREGKAAADRDLERVREQLELRELEVDELKGEIVSLRKEREEVKARVEKMLQQMDALIGQ